MGNNFKALVVEESSVIKNLMKTGLEKMGLESEFIESGLSALNSLQKSSYDIIFIDAMTENKAGYKACKFIKSLPENQETPIVMLTSRDGAIDKIRGKLAGADYYLSKPIVMSELKTLIEQCVPLNYTGTKQVIFETPNINSASSTKHRSLSLIKGVEESNIQVEQMSTAKPIKKFSREEKIAQIRKLME